MSYHVMEDLMHAVPVNVHTEDCPHFIRRDVSATTTRWHNRETIDEAEDLARRLARAKGAKRCGTCMDNRFLR
jgi:hypothetical protein